MNYYILNKDEAVGPYSKDEVFGMVASGLITRDAMVAVEGGEQWKLVTDWPGLAPVREAHISRPKISSQKTGMDGVSKTAAVIVGMFLPLLGLVIGLLKLGAEDKTEAYFFLRWGGIGLLVSVLFYGAWRL